MSIIRQPSEIQEKKNLVMMVYGAPGIGKSTVAMSAPSPVLIDTDGGVGRTHTAHRCPTVQVTKWEDVQQAMDEIAATTDFKTIIVDTVGKLLDYMSEYITRTQPKMRKGYDGSLSLQGYGVRKTMFREFVKRCMMARKNVVFVAHAQEDKVDDSFVERPIVGGSSMNDIMMEIDLLGFMTDLGGRRVVLWGNDGSTFAKSFYSKNTCFLPNVMDVPQVVDYNGNVIAENRFLTDVLEHYEEAQKRKEEQNKAYDELVKSIRERVDAAESSEDLDKLLADFGRKDFGHIFDSKIISGKALREKALELGLKFSKVEGKFVKDGIR